MSMNYSYISRTFDTRFDPPFVGNFSHDFPPEERNFLAQWGNFEPSVCDLEGGKKEPKIGIQMKFDVYFKTSLD
eukprot:UN13546